jgi:hypothetical protein
MSNCLRDGTEPWSWPCHLSQIRKMKKLNKQVPHELNENETDRLYEVCSALLLCKREKKVYWLSCDVQWKVDLIQQPPMIFTAPKHFPKPKLHQKKVNGHCLVVCSWCYPLQLSESRGDCYCREVLLRNWDNVPKITQKTASGGQSKRTSLASW